MRPVVPRPHASLTCAHSLSATFFRNRIVGALRTAGDPVLRGAAHHVPANVVFAHPSVARLARALHAIVDPVAQPAADRPRASSHRARLMDSSPAEAPGARASCCTWDSAPARAR